MTDRLRGYREEILKGFRISDDDLLAYNIDPKTVDDITFSEIAKVMTDSLQEEEFGEHFKRALQEVGLL